MVTPSEGLERLRAAAGSGELRVLCQRRNVNLITVFGSVGGGEPDPRDLDIGVLTEHGADFDLFGFVTDVIELVGLEQVDVAHRMTPRRLDPAVIQERLRAIPLALEQYGQYVRHVARWLRDHTAASRGCHPG